MESRARYASVAGFFHSDEDPCDSSVVLSVSVAYSTVCGVRRFAVTDVAI